MVFPPISDERIPATFRAGIIFGMLQTTNREEWTVEIQEDDGSIREVRGVPRHLTKDDRGSFWFPSQDASAVPFLRLSGLVESFVPVDRISHIGTGSSDLDPYRETAKDVG